MKKIIIFLVSTVLAFLVANAAFAAGVCPQERKTKKAPADIFKMKIPKGTDWKHGKKIYKDQKYAQSAGAPMACFNCHGDKGVGDGKLGKAFTPKPRNFTCKKTMKKVSAGQMYWIIKNGSEKTGMVPHAKFSDEDIWGVVKYIRGVLMKKGKKKKKKR